MNSSLQRSRWRASQGFTLVEVMVASFVGLLVISMSLSSFLALSYSAAGSVNAAAIHSQLRKGMDHVTADLISVSNIVAYLPQSYIIYNALTPSGVMYGYLYYNRYGRSVYSYRGGSSKVLLTNIDGMTFTLFDENGAETSVAADAVSVGVKIDGSRRAARQSYSDQVFARILLRNK